METFTFNGADRTRLVGWRNEGSGPRVLLCNGMASPAEAWPRLCQPDAGFDVASWNMRGFGGSDRPGNLPEGISLPVQSEDAVRLMDHLGWDRVIFLGWSFGVNMATEVAIKYPERISGLVAVAGVPGGTFHALLGDNPLPMIVRKQLGVAGTRVGESQAFGLNAIAGNLNTIGLATVAEIMQRGGMFGPLARKEDLIAAVRFYLGHDWAWFFRAVRIMAEHEPLDVSVLRLPAEVLVAMQDMITDPVMVEQFGRSLPGADVKLLQVSHFLPMEAPEEVLAALTRIVKRVELTDRLQSAAIEPEAGEEQGPDTPAPRTN
jgi:3-oxoadipate enol-lactonase